MIYIGHDIIALKKDGFSKVKQNVNKHSAESNIPAQLFFKSFINSISNKKFFGKWTSETSFWLILYAEELRQRPYIICKFKQNDKQSNRMEIDYYLGLSSLLLPLFISLIVGLISSIYLPGLYVLLIISYLIIYGVFVRYILSRVKKAIKAYILDGVL
jgi:hypothetical protein